MLSYNFPIAYPFHDTKYTISKMIKVMVYLKFFLFSKYRVQFSFQNWIQSNQCCKLLYLEYVEMTIIFSWIPLFSHGFHYIPMDSIIFSWNPLFSHGFHYFPMDSIIFQWIPLFSHGFRYFLKDSIIFSWIPLFSHGFHYISMD